MKTVFPIVGAAAVIAAACLTVHRFVPIELQHPPVYVSHGVDTWTTPHPVYRYSVVAGGVWSAEDMQTAVAHDPVVAKHYAGLQFDGKVPPFTTLVDEPSKLAYYVSYRKNNRIYWTRYKVAVEGVLWVVPNPATDRFELIRARCGNRLSEAPRQPTLPPGQEPLAADLDDAPPADTLTPAPDVPERPDILAYIPGAPFPGAAPLAGGSTNTPRAPMAATDVMPTNLYIMGGPIAERTDDAAIVPAAAVPEPNAIGIVLAGLGVLIVGWAFRRSKHK